MLDAGFQALWWLSGAVALSAAVGVVFATRRRWLPARTWARAAVFGSLALPPLDVGWMIYGFSQVADAESMSKAAVLARAISCGLNCSVLVVPSFVAALVVRTVSRRRLRATSGGIQA